MLEKFSDLRVLSHWSILFFMVNRLSIHLPNPLWVGLLLLPTILCAFWTVEQADAQGFVVQPAQAQLELRLYDAYSVEDLLHDFAEQTDPEVIAFMAHYIVALESKDWPKGYRGQFLQDVAPAALISAHSHQIPPSIVIGQAVFESGWGRSNLAVNFNNLFGIKGTGEGTVKIRTFERNSRNRRYGKWARFKVFNSRGDAILYHGRLLAKDRRYASARANKHHWRAFMDKASKYYASDPNYTTKLGVIIDGYQLDRWDRLMGYVSETSSTTKKSEIIASK